MILKMLFIKLNFMRFLAIHGIMGTRPYEISALVRLLSQRSNRFVPVFYASSSGIPQCFHIAPFLFTIFINDTTVRHGGKCLMMTKGVLINLSRLLKTIITARTANILSTSVVE